MVPICDNGSSLADCSINRYKVPNRPNGPHSLLRVEMAAAQSADSWRKIDFQTLLARAFKRSVVRENNVAAIRTDQPPVGKDRHWMEFPSDDAIGTTFSFFLLHCRRRSFASRPVTGHCLFPVIGRLTALPICLGRTARQS